MPTRCFNPVSLLTYVPHDCCGYRALVGPTVAGIILFLFQWNNGTPDDPLLPAFCILLMMWTMGFVEIWKRRNASIAFKWGVDGVEDEERMRVSAEKVRSRLCFEFV